MDVLVTEEGNVLCSSMFCESWTVDETRCKECPLPKVVKRFKGIVDLNELWHDVSEEADLSKSVLLYDVDGGWMSPPSKFLFKDMQGFVYAMNRKYGANYTKWVYMEDILPSKKN